MHKFVRVFFFNVAQSIVGIGRLRLWLRLHKNKIPTNDLHCTSRTENHILFHCICISGFSHWFFFALNSFSHLKEMKKKTTRNDTMQAHKNNSIGFRRSNFFISSLFISGLLCAKGIKNWFAIFVVSRKFDSIDMARKRPTENAAEMESERQRTREKERLLYLSN